MLASFFSLTACETEEVKPKANPEAKLTDSNDLVFQRYYITERGSSTMEYDVDYRLKKVNLTPNNNVQYDWYTQNNTQFVSAKTFVGGKMLKKAVYSLNSKNKAIKVVSNYYNPVGSLIKTETHGLEYNNTTGKLRRIYNTDPNINEQTLFDFSGNNIRRIPYINLTTNVRKYTDYWYTNSSYPTVQLDKYRFNVELENLDFYPKIFGSFSKHLPVRTRLRTVSGGNSWLTLRDFKYSFDPKGYVSTRQLIDGATNNLLYAEDYDYKVVLVGM